MTHALIKLLGNEMQKLKDAGLYKRDTPPRRRARPDAASDFTSQDYLGLCTHQKLRDAASVAVAEEGMRVPTSSLTGTRPETEIALEKGLAKLVGKPSAMVFPSGYTANIGLFESIFDSRDAVFCDAWVHPSVGAGIRLSGAQESAFRATRLHELEDRLKRSRSARFRAIVVDGVSAISGEIVELSEICDLAENYEALVIVDDSLGIGVVGDGGSGTVRMRQELARVDIITGSCGKALAAGAGGFVAANKEITDWMRQKATSYLFSHPLSPVHTFAANEALQLLTQDPSLPRQLADRVERMNAGLRGLGFRVLGGQHPNLCIHVGEVIALQRMINHLYQKGMRVNGLCYPVVPEQKSRLRLQITLAHDGAAIDRALENLEKVGHKLAILS